MARGFKGNVWQLVKTHRASFVDANTGRRRWSDHLAFEGLPLAAAILIGWFDVRLRPTASAGLLTIAGLLSAFLFGVMLQISDRAMNWADSEPTPSRTTSEDADYLEEMAANAGYASLICIAASAAFVVASMTSHNEWALRISSAVGLGLGLHLVLTLLMVMKRVFAFTQHALRRARTGPGRSESPGRRSGRHAA